MKANKLSEAIECYSTAILLNPSIASYWSNRSLVHGSLKNWEDSLADAVESISKDPKWIKGHLRKGEALRELNRLFEATLAYNEGLKIEPNNELLKKGLESILMKEPKTNQFPSNISEEAEKWKVKGNEALKSNLQEALSCYSNAIALDPNSALYYTNRAIVHGLLNNWEKALTDAESSISKDPNWIKGYLRKAEALKELNRPAEAKQVLQRALQVSPDNQLVLQQLNIMGQ